MANLKTLVIKTILVLIICSSVPAKEVNETAKADSDHDKEDSDHDKEDSDHAKTDSDEPHAKTHAEWSYADAETGPAMWASMGYPHCGRQLQSPINIDSKKISPYDYSDLIKFKHYDDVAEKVTVKNNGHTLVAMFDYGPVGWRPSVSGGQLSGTYEFEQLHFHWGTENEKPVGAEHTIDGVRGPMEMHMVHRNVKYKTMLEAVNSTDGILVLAALFEMNTNKAMPLLKSVQAVSERVVPFGGSATLQPRTLASQLPEDTTDFFHYRGSLTTPGCQESVDWVVFNRRMNVIVGQVHMLGTLLRENNETIVSNFRPTQKLNNRKVYHMVYKNPGLIVLRASAPGKLQTMSKVYGLTLLVTVLCRISVK